MPPSWNPSAESRGKPYVPRTVGRSLQNVLVGASPDNLPRTVRNSCFPARHPRLGQFSPYCGENHLVPLADVQGEQFSPYCGENSTHRPQVRHDGSLPRTVEGKPKLRIAGSVINGLPRAVERETLHSLMAGPSPMKSPCAISTQGLWKGRLHPKTGRGRGNPLRRDSLSSLRLNCPSTRTSRFPFSRQWRSSRVRRR